MRHLRVKPLDNEVCHIFEPFTDRQVDILRQEMAAIDKEFNMTSSSTAVRIQDLPFNKNVLLLVISSQLVQKFHRTLKQYPSGQNPNDWRCQYRWDGCKKLRAIVHFIRTARCMHGIRPHDWHQHAYQLTSGRCHHSLLATRSAEQNLGLASIQAQLGELPCEDVACGDVLISPSLLLRCTGYQADAR